MNQTLKQIPEDVYDSADVMSSSAQKDQLANEVDRLLKKSYDMENEGDLLAAAALCDSAASKARQAIDMPYSNHQLLVSANMKYSECVMRSTRLHKKLLEKDAEERRILKEYHHSRQSSRDSTHGRHSRQNSRDSKDTFAVNNKQPNKEAYKGNNNLEVYATLPKKNKANKKKAQLQTSAADLNCSGPIYTNVELIRAMEQAKKPRKEVFLVMKDSDFSDYYSEWDGLTKQTKNQQQQARRQTLSGSQSCRENDSESYGEVCSPNKNEAIIKKQCKVKRKLMFGNLLKNKNKSLPDLREDALDDKPKAIETKENTAPVITIRQTSVANIHSKGFHQAHRSFVAERGLNSKPSLLKVAPPLIRDIKSNTIANDTTNIERSQSMKSRQSLPPLPPPKKSTISNCQPVKQACEDLKTNSEQNPFFREINQKRLELQKIRAERMAQSLMPLSSISQVGGIINMTRPQESSLDSNTIVNNNSATTNNNNNTKKPSSHEIINFITRYSTVRGTTTSNDNSALMNQRVKEIVNSMTVRGDKLSLTTLSSPASIYSPIPIHAASNKFNGMTPTASYINQMRLNRPPDYETTLKRMTATNNTSVSNISNINEADGISGNHNAINVPAPSKAVVLSVASQQPSSVTHVKQKKSVKFSDTVEMVATADTGEDDLQSFLSNPILKKVLGNREFPGAF